MINVRNKILATITLAAVSAHGHYTWVAPSEAWTPGKPLKIMVAHGDRFPHGDEAINATQVKLWMLAANGTKTDLKPVATKSAVLADYTPAASAGPQRIVFTQDRGILSRTPKGVKAGARDQNPTATEVFSILRTGVHYIGSQPQPTPVGLELELTARFENGVWHLQLLRSGKPLAGQTISVLLKEQEKETAIGKSGTDGKLTFTPAAGYKGPLLFLAELKEKLSGGPVDSRTVSTSTFVTCI